MDLWQPALQALQILALAGLDHLNILTCGHLWNFGPRSGTGEASVRIKASLSSVPLCDVAPRIGISTLPLVSNVRAVVWTCEQVGGL